MIQQQTKRRREGVVLLAVLIVLVLLSLAAYQYSDLMTAEFMASDNYHKTAQARAFADSGIYYAAALLSNADNLANHLNNNPYDNQEAFKDIAVADDDAKAMAGRFTLIAPVNPDDDDSSATMRHGVSDESGKINVNAMMKIDPTGKQLHDMLMKLPNMTDEIANSIVYWADASRTPRAGGAADDYYGSLNPPYRTRNGPLDTIDELLLVKGVTPQFLYGTDLNRNGILDAEENDGSGTFDRGWSAFLTVHSREQNLNTLEQPRENINGSDLNSLYQQLSQGVGADLAKFVILYRQYGPTNSSGNQQNIAATIASTSSGDKSQVGGGMTLVISFGSRGGGGGTSSGTQVGKLSSFNPDLTKQAKTRIDSLFELVNVQVTVPGKTPRDPSTVYTSPLKDAAMRKDLLPKLFETATVFEESEIPARINVNTAPREVLAALPELTDADVQSIISLRPKYSGAETPAEIFKTPAWLLTEANLKVETLRKLEKIITTRTQVYRVQVLGQFGNDQGPVARVEAVIDTNGGRPRIVAYRDLSDLGRGTTGGNK
jgi:type II secretory pathway component PulK